MDERRAETGSLPLEPWWRWVWTGFISCQAASSTIVSGFPGHQRNNAGGSIVNIYKAMRLFSYTDRRFFSLLA
jgi:hypothetical protein